MKWILKYLVEVQDGAIQGWCSECLKRFICIWRILKVPSLPHLPIDAMLSENSRFVGTPNSKRLVAEAYRGARMPLESQLSPFYWLCVTS